MAKIPESKMTDWFKGKTKPARIGLYQRDPKQFGHLGLWYSYWDGVEWFSAGFCPSDAMRNYKAKSSSGYPILPWRGLKEEHK